MTEPFDPDAFVRTVAPVVGLSLTPDERSAVAVQMARIQALAQLVLEFPLAPQDEAAPRFEP